MVGTDLTYNIHDYILGIWRTPTSPPCSPAPRRGQDRLQDRRGFQKWTPEQVAQSNAELNEYLIRMLYGK